LVKYWEDYKVGDKFVSRGRTITETIVSVCCGLLGANETFVWDEEEAKKSIFKSRIAPGPLMLALVDALSLVSQDNAQPFIDPKTDIALLGIEGKFKSPAHIGDTVVAHLEISDKRETKNSERGILYFKSILYNQENIELIEANTVAMVKRRDNG
jgi:acyl dehydratase